MQSTIKSLWLGLGLSLSLVLALSFNSMAAAHVVVSPSEVLSSSRVTFAVSVPNEHDTPVVGLKLIVPSGLSSVRPFVKAGWDIDVVTSGQGEDLSASQITWTSNGSDIPVNLKDEFLFSAKAPSDTTSLKWQAYETYQSGLVVAWDQDPSIASSDHPYSVTRVISEDPLSAQTIEANDTAELASAKASRAIYLATASLAITVVGIFLITRRPRD